MFLKKFNECRILKSMSWKCTFVIMCLRPKDDFFFFFALFGSEQHSRQYLICYCCSCFYSHFTYVCGCAGSSPNVTLSPWMSLKHFSQKWYLKLHQKNSSQNYCFACSAIWGQSNKSDTTECANGLFCRSLVLSVKLCCWTLKCSVQVWKKVAITRFKQQGVQGTTEKRRH